MIFLKKLKNLKNKMENLNLAKLLKRCTERIKIILTSFLVSVN